MLTYFPMQSNWPAVTAASECAHRIICRDAHRQRNSEVLPHRSLSLQSTMLWIIIPFNQCLSASSVFDVLDEVTEPGHVVQHQPGSAWTQLKRQQWTEQAANMDVASKEGLLLENIITSCLCLFIFGFKAWLLCKNLSSSFGWKYKIKRSSDNVVLFCFLFF